jgi:hypothetical protein
MIGWIIVSVKTVSSVRSKLAANMLQSCDFENFYFALKQKTAGTISHPGFVFQRFSF